MYHLLLLSGNLPRESHDPEIEDLFGRIVLHGFRELRSGGLTWGAQLLHLGKFGDLEAVEGSKQGQSGSIESGCKIQFFPSRYTWFTSFTSITTVIRIRDRIGMACQLGNPFQD